MTFHRLRDRLGTFLGGLLMALILATLIIVGWLSARDLTDEVHKTLAAAPVAVQVGLDQPEVRQFHQLGAQFESVQVDLKGEPLKRKDPDYADFLATLRDSVQSSLMDPETDRHCPDLALVANAEDMQLVVDLRRNGKEVLNRNSRLGGANDQAELLESLPRLPWILRSKAEQTAQADFFRYPAGPEGSLYLATAVPLRVSVGGDFSAVYALTVLGRRMDGARAAREAALTGCMVLIAATRPDGGFDLQAGARPGDKPEILSRDELDSFAGPLRKGKDRVVVRDHHYLVQTRELDEVGRVFYLKDLHEVGLKVRDEILVLAGLGAVGLLGSILISWRFAGGITRPIESLAAKMNQVGQGDLEQQAEIQGDDEVAQLGNAFNRMTRGLRQKEAFKKLAPHGARREIEESGDSEINLGGRWIQATILFSDLRGFTSMAEKLTPTEVVELLNEYLQAMSTSIEAHGGDINEYIGDAILAVFHEREGAQSGQLAVRAALDMQAALFQLRQKSANPIIQELRMGIGLHSGDLVEGWIGTRERMKYGVVGDTVNLAARIQDRSRDGHYTSILISGATKDQLGDEFQLEFFGDEALKGKTGTTPIWEVVRSRSK